VKKDRFPRRSVLASPRGRVAAACLLACALLLSGCRDTADPPPLVQIGERTIALHQFQQIAARSTASDPDRQQSAAEKQQLQRQILGQLIDRQLILAEADRQGLKVDANELNQALKDLRGSYSAADYQEVLVRAGKNPEQWRQQTELRLLTRKVQEQITRDVTISSDDVLDYYRKHQQQFQHPERIRAQQITVETRQQADQIYNRLQSGENFTTVARSLPHSADHEQGEDLGFFARGQLPAEFDSVLFTLPSGAYSTPVASPYGFHLFHVLEKRAAGLESFDEIRTQLTDRLERESKEQVFTTWLQLQRQQTPIYIDWTQISGDN